MSKKNRFRIRCLSDDFVSDVFTDFSDSGICGYLFEFEIYDSEDFAVKGEVYPCDCFREDGTYDLEKTDDEIFRFIANRVKHYFILEYLDEHDNVLEEESFDVYKHDSLITDFQEYKANYVYSKFEEWHLNFLSNGTWHFGIEFESGEVVECDNRWPVRKCCINDVAWFDTVTGESVKPIIWFGLKGDQPLKIWSLRKGTYDFWFFKRKYETDIVPLESIWGGNYSSIHYIWYVCEYGMEINDDGFVKARASCPVDLDGSDDDILASVEKLFMEHMPKI